MRVTKRMQEVLNNAQHFCGDYLIIEQVRYDILRVLDDAGLTYIIDHGHYQETWLTPKGIEQRSK